MWEKTAPLISCITAFEVVHSNKKLQHRGKRKKEAWPHEGKAEETFSELVSYGSTFAINGYLRHKHFKMHS